MLQRAFAVMALVFVVFVAGPALAKGPVNKTLFGNAIDGYDPVAYHQGKGPVEGSRSITYDWNGATWWFVSEENRDLFAADPERYAPVYGGYCAYGVAVGNKVGFDPEAWTIFEDKLYLNLNKGIQKRWLKDIPGYIKKADANWRKLKNK